MMIIDYADNNDLSTQDYIKIVSSLNTLTTMIIKITWKKILSWFCWLCWYIAYSDDADYVDIQLYVKNNFIIDYTDYVVMKGYYW